MDSLILRIRGTIAPVGPLCRQVQNRSKESVLSAGMRRGTPAERTRIFRTIARGWPVPRKELQGIAVVPVCGAQVIRSCHRGACTLYLVVLTSFDGPLSVPSMATALTT
jgi:hypothetical protein